MDGVLDGPGEVPPRVLALTGPPVPQRKAAELIADELRQLIVCGGRVGDYLLAERLLIERFDVSRPTLREALRVLESEGLVEIRRGVRGGAVVREPDLAGLARHFGIFLQLNGVAYEDAFVVRRIVEPAAARLSAQRTADGVPTDRLEAALEQEASAISSQDGAARLSNALVDFHDAVLELCGSTTLLALGKLLEMVSASHTHHSMAAIPQRREQLAAARRSHEAHQHLATAILAGDAERAHRLMCAHLDALRSSTDSPRDEDSINMFQPGRTGKIIELP